MFNSGAQTSSTLELRTFRPQTDAQCHWRSGRDRTSEIIALPTATSLAAHLRFPAEYFHLLPGHIIETTRVKVWCCSGTLVVNETYAAPPGIILNR